MIDDLRDEIARLKENFKEEPMMNDERKEKLLLLAGIMEDVLLEEECMRIFFKDIRGGEAV